MTELVRNEFPAGDYLSQAQLFRKYFKSKGCSVKRIGRLLEVEYNGRVCHMLETETTNTSLLAYRMLKDKRVARSLFERIRVNTAVGAAFSSQDRSAALEKVKELGLAVIKPADGNKGRGVSVGVTTENFDDAWRSALAATHSQILVEQCFENGVEARYCVIDGECVAVHSRMPPSVTGDGVSSIQELNDRRNELLLKLNPSRRNTEAIIDEHRKNLLAGLGFSLDSVPAFGEKVILDWKAGISTGGDAQNITSQVHPEMIRIAESIALAIPGLDICGVDILARDHAIKPSDENYIVLEANTRPGLSGHQYPDFGEPIDVSKLVVESVMRRMRIG
ncbi:hypothetical protein M0G74_10050 [Microbulbifer sp. CAU 1566]|uniref:ATP-binding protein n=1 Tax=Microbulbifer sp. CAU 1566 TaxID=2933269 RepID=UPI0020033780|nr:hypothetical protein [Microbulbifer sp. CAU 1566]MCK7597608.1 hypothetical protein [Microbulbifer sp. CAU 1566]